MLEAEEDVDENTPLKELDKLEESSSSTSFSAKDALSSLCRGLFAKFIPHRATQTQPVEQPDAAFANVMSAMDGTTAGSDKGGGRRRRRSSAAKHGDSESSDTDEDTSEEEDEKKDEPGESKEEHVKGTSAPALTGADVCCLHCSRSVACAGPPSVAEGKAPASRGDQTRSYAVPERSTWHTRIKNDDRFHPKTLSPKDRRDVLREYKRRLMEEKHRKQAL